MPIWLSALPASNDKLRFSLVFLVVLVLLEFLAVLVLLVARKPQFYLAFFYIFHLGCSVFC